MVLDLHSNSTHSLKEKRKIVSSMKEKLKNKFNISLIESDHQDLWQKIQERPLARLVETDVARRVAWGVQNLEA